MELSKAEWFLNLGIAGIKGYWKNLWYQVISYLLMAWATNWVMGLSGLCIGTCIGFIVCGIKGVKDWERFTEFFELLREVNESYKANKEVGDLVYIGVRFGQWLRNSVDSEYRRVLATLVIHEWSGMNEPMLEALSAWEAENEKLNIDEEIELVFSYDVDLDRYMRW